MNTRPSRRDIAALAKADPRMGRLLEEVGPFPDLRAANTARSHFHALARAIIYQQLAGKAASTIHDRFRRSTSGSGFPSPGEVCRLPEKTFRSAGISRGKQRAITALADAIESGTLSLRSIGRRSDDEVIEQLTRIHGIGKWTAQMFLMFRLGRLDVMPATDLGVQEGMRILDRLDRRPTPAELMERAECWSPLRSVATWCLYRAVDMNRAGKSIQAT